MHQQSQPLSGLQLAILRVIWLRGEATAQEIEDNLHDNRRTAYSTIATLLGRLAKRGVVEHHVRGRQYVYRALVDEKDIRRSMIGQLVDDLFQGRTSDLLQHLVSERHVQAEDIDEMRRLITSRGRASEGSTPEPAKTHESEVSPAPYALPSTSPLTWAPEHNSLPGHQAFGEESSAKA